MESATARLCACDPAVLRFGPPPEVPRGWECGPGRDPKPGLCAPPDPIETDATAFRAHIGAAQQVGAAAAEADQHEHLVAALALVQGPILPALDHLDTVRLFINDIEEHRCWEARELVEVDLRRGRASDVIPRLRTRAWLSALVDDEPLTLEQRNIARVSWPPWPNFGGDYGTTSRLAEDALAAARELGDDRRLNAALITSGTTAVFEGDVKRAAECFIDSAQLTEALGDLGGIAASMAFWGVAHRRMGQFDDAKRCFDKAFEGFSRLADDRGMALVIANSGRLAHQLGDLERGRELTRRGWSW